MSRGFQVEPEPLPFKDAIEAFRGRLPLSPDEYRALSDEAKIRAFTLSGVASEDLIGEVFRGIDRAVANGETFESFQQSFLPKLEKAWGKDAPHRLETAFSTNVQSAYQAGRYKALSDPDVRSEYPLWQYDAVNDGRTRPAHRALDGKVVRADDPFWETHYPPNGFRCFPPGVRVLTRHGKRPIEEVRAGDEVLTHKGRFRKVLQAFSNPSPKRLVQLSLLSGRKLTATANHPALTNRGWVELSGIRPGDHLFYVGKVPHEDRVVGYRQGQDSRLADGAQASGWNTVSYFSQFNAEVGVGQIEVDEVEVFTRHKGTLKLEGVSLLLEPGGEKGLCFGRLNNCLNVRTRIGAMFALLGLRGFFQSFDSQRQLAFFKFLGRACKAWMGFLCLTFRPMNPLRRILGHPFAHDLGLTFAPLGAAFPLAGNSFAPMPYLNTVLFEEGSNARNVARAQDRHHLPIRKPLGHIEIMEKTGESVAMLRQQTPFNRTVVHSLNDTTATPETVVCVERVEAISERVYNFSVEEDESYIADGYVVHNCRCGVISLSEAGAAERGLQVADREEAAKLSRDHLPDKGFAVNVGKTTWGETLAEGVLAESGDRWQPLMQNPKGPVDYGRPELIPMSARPAALLPTIAEAGGREAFLAVLAERWGGETIVVQGPRGEGVIASRILLEHLKEDGRERFLSLVPDLISSPFEIWVMPLKDTRTGRVTLRRRYLKSYQDERRRNLLLAAEVRKGVLEAWTLFETRDANYFQRQRLGILLFGD